MGAPFYNKQSNCYQSTVWPGLILKREERHLLVHLNEPVDSLSSAIYGGGLGKIDHVANIYVNRHYECHNPEQDVKKLLTEWGYPLTSSAGLLTAVLLEYASVEELVYDEAALFCCTTAGVSNGARAGSLRKTFPVYEPGTINIILMIDAKLTPAAMVNTIITATEAKAAALADLGIRDVDNKLVATGTTTDSIVLGVSQSSTYPIQHRYCGTATHLGAAISRLVYQTVTESVQAGGLQQK